MLLRRPLILDITNPDHIRALADRVHGDPQGRAVRALMNNAGMAVNAPIEVFALDNRSPKLGNELGQLDAQEWSGSA